MDGGFSLLLLVGTGALLLKPRDIPPMARVVGRAVGAAVRSLRIAKSAAEEVIAENVKQANDPNSELRTVGRGLRDSLSKFDSVTAAVRKDMADVPLSPRMWIQKGVRSLDQAAQTGHTAKRDESDSSPVFTGEASAKHWRHNDRQTQTPLSRKSIHAANNSSGVDFIARAIEEAALAQQRKRVFAGPFQGDDQTKLNKPTTDET